MATGDREITQLPKAASTARQGVFAIVDPITDKTVQLAVQASLGAERADMDWQSDTTYAIDDFVLYNGLTAWKSLQNSNTGNVPAENTWWTAITISPADGITDTQHANGLFTYDDSKIIYNNIQYYLQIAAPYESSNIATEIGAGDWAVGGTGATGISVVNAATYTMLASDEILNVIYTITGSVTITIPTAIITNGFNKLVVKDAGGNSGTNSITINTEGSETIDGAANLIINGNYNSANLYSETANLFIY